MSDLYSKYGWIVIEILTGVVSVALILSILFNTSSSNPELFSNISQTVEGADVTYDVPYLGQEGFKVEGAILEKDSEFNWRDYVTVRTSNGLDLEDYVIVTGEVDTGIPGKYSLLFEINFNGEKLSREAFYYVKGGNYEIFSR